MFSTWYRKPRAVPTVCVVVYSSLQRLHLDTISDILCSRPYIHCLSYVEPPIRRYQENGGASATAVSGIIYLYAGEHRSPCVFAALLSSFLNSFDLRCHILIASSMYRRSRVHYRWGWGSWLREPQELSVLLQGRYIRPPSPSKPKDSPSSLAICCKSAHFAARLNHHTNLLPSMDCDAAPSPGPIPDVHTPPTSISPVDNADEEADSSPSQLHVEQPQLGMWSALCYCAALLLYILEFAFLLFTCPPVTASTLDSHTSTTPSNEPASKLDCSSAPSPTVPLSSESVSSPMADDIPVLARTPATEPSPSLITAATSPVAAFSLPVSPAIALVPPSHGLAEPEPAVTLYVLSLSCHLLVSTLTYPRTTELVISRTSPLEQQLQLSVAFATHDATFLRHSLRYLPPLSPPSPPPIPHLSSFHYVTRNPPPHSPRRPICSPKLQRSLLHLSPPHPLTPLRSSRSPTLSQNPKCMTVVLGSLSSFWSMW